MAIHFTTTVEGDTLIARASGFDENLEDVQNYGMGLIQACSESGVTRVLCDERELDYRLSTIDTYQAGEFISANAPAVARAAIVCQPKCVADARFWEDVAVNRGLCVRVFTSLDEGRRWLKDGGSGS
jgi:hypothetical protein